MSHRTPYPPSPGLPPILYSGMSSLQISQAGPASTAGVSSHQHTPQSQKALLKGPKTARHQSRKSEHPSTPAPWKDPPASVAASAGRKQTRREDAFVRHKQPIFAGFAPEARPTTEREEVYMLHSLSDAFREQNMYVNNVFDDLNRKLDLVAEQNSARERLIQRACDAFEVKILEEERHTRESLDREKDPVKRQRYRELREPYHAYRREALMDARGGPSRST